MKKLTIRLPDAVVADIEAEARKRKVSKSRIVRERLGARADSHRLPPSLDDIAHVIGSVTGLPSDLSANTKRYLKATGYGLKRPR